MKNTLYTSLGAAAILAVLVLTPASSQAHTTEHGIDAANVTSVRHIANRTIENRDLAAFEGIRVEGIADVFLTQDANQAVQVDAEAGAAEHVTTTVEKGILIIRTDKSLNSGKPVKVYVTAPKFTDLELSGTGNLIGMTPITSPELTLTSSGAGSIQLSVETQTLASAIFGVGSMNVTGHADAASISVEGAGDYHGRKLAAQQVSVLSSGAGDIEVNASSKLTVQLSGSGDVRYIGDVAQVTSHISGSGTIRKLPSAGSRG